MREGQELVPWPEGDRYPGFVFARAGTPEQVEAALREANRRLDLVLAPVLPVVVGRERAKKTGLAAGQIR